mgnify:CR=1 FL=1
MDTFTLTESQKNSHKKYQAYNRPKCSGLEEKLKFHKKNRNV